MTESVHGHEVMRRMIGSRKTHTQSSLRTAMSTWFGADARFHTCSAQNMTADELIAFFTERGKFSPAESGFRIKDDEICGDV